MLSGGMLSPKHSPHLTSKWYEIVGTAVHTPRKKVSSRLASWDHVHYFQRATRSRSHTCTFKSGQPKKTLVSIIHRDGPRNRT